MRIKVTKILYVLLVLSFIKFPFFSTLFLRFLKGGTAGITLLYLIQYRYIHIKKQFYILLYCGVILLSGYTSYHLGTRFWYSLVYAIEIYELVVLTDVWINTHGTYNYFQVMFYFILVVCFMNDVFMFINIGTTAYVTGSGYILGTKFGVAYYHLLLLMFLAVMLEERDKGRRKGHFRNPIFWVMVAYSVFISIEVNTRTGLVGILFFATLYLISDFIKELLINPIVTCIILYALSATIFFWDYILSFQVVQNIIVTVLNRSLSLTGRRAIYRVLYEIFKQRPLLGWGYEATIVEEILSFGNAQNGIVHLAIQYGIIGLLCFTFFVFGVMKKCKDSHAPKMAIVCAMYSFFVMGTVEIVFSKLFFIIMAILFAFADQNKDVHIHKRRVKIKI